MPWFFWRPPSIVGRMEPSYPVWIDADTDVRLRRSRSKHRGHLAFDAGREGEPIITLVGSLDALQRLIVEADRRLARWKGDLGNPHLRPGCHD